MSTVSSSTRHAVSAAAWLTLLVLPFVYFLSENHATLFLEIGATAGFIACCVFLYRGRIRLTPTSRGIAAILGTWLLLAGRSVLISADPSSSLPVFAKAAALAMLFLTTSAGLAATRDFSLFFRPAAWAGIVHGLLAIQEYVEAPPIPATWLDPASKSFFRTRCAGIFTDPNIFAAFLAVLLLFSIGLLLNARNRYDRSVAAASLSLGGIGILTTLSRGGWIGLGMGIIVLSILCSKSRVAPDRSTKQIMLGVAMILLLVFSIGPFKMRFFSIGNPADMTFAQRTLINKGILNALNRFPIAGHGLHSFNQVYPRYRIVGGDYPMNAHNEFIHSLIETGFLSALLLLGLCFRLILLGAKQVDGSGSELPVFTAAFTTLVIHNLSGFSSRILPTVVLLAICAGGILAVAVVTSASDKAGKTNNRLLAPFMALLAIGSFWLGLNAFFLQNKLQEARELMRNNQPGQAVTMLEQLIAQEPGNSHVYAALATAFMQIDQPEHAKKAWKKAAELNCSEALFFIYLARLAIEENDPAAAEKHFQRALLLDPASENFRLEFALFLLKQGRKSDALAQLQVGMVYSPGFHDVYTGFRAIENLKGRLLNTNH